jgi:hypothetical protein
VRVRKPHFVRPLECRVDLNEISPFDARAEAGSLVPLARLGNHLGPEGKDPALSGFRWMYGAAIRTQEMAGASARDSQPPLVPRPIDVAAFKCRGSHRQEVRGTHDILLSQVYEALLGATVRAARLTGEAQTGYP